MTIPNIQSISLDQLLEIVGQLKQSGWRMLGITATPTDEGLEMMYHFDKDLNMKHLKLASIDTGESVPSLCSIYDSSFLVENELRDQFKIHFTGLSPDYRKTFFLEDDLQTHPLFSGASAKVEHKDQQS